MFSIIFSAFQSFSVHFNNVQSRSVIFSVSVVIHPSAKTVYDAIGKILESGSIVSQDELKKHVCELCSMAFASAAHLTSHLPVHDKNRPKYKCSYPDCEKEYNDIKNWRPHFKSKHMPKGITEKAKKKITEEFEKQLVVN